MKGFSTKAYLAIGLSFLVASIVMASAFVGVFPDRGSAVREGRQALAELAAVNSTAAIVPEGAPRVEAMLKFMLERNKDLVSAGVRRARRHARRSRSATTPTPGSRSPTIIRPTASCRCRS